MKRFLLKFNCLILAFGTFSCSQVNVSAPNRIELPALRGFVNFGESKFTTKATAADVVKNGATVSLINQETGKSIAVGLTTETGEFFLVSNYKVPIKPAEVLDKFLILEAHRRVSDNVKGNLVSLRSLIKLRSSDYKFESITGTGVHGINSITTAIGVMVLKNQIPVLNDILSKVQISPDDPTVVTNVNDVGSISAGTVLDMKNEVEKNLAVNIDPVLALVSGCCQINIIPENGSIGPGAVYVKE
jgi:hypothetical protein